MFTLTRPSDAVTTLNRNCSILSQQWSAIARFYLLATTRHCSLLPGLIFLSASQSVWHCSAGIQQSQLKHSPEFHYHLVETNRQDQLRVVVASAIARADAAVITTAAQQGRAAERRQIRSGLRRCKLQAVDHDTSSGKRHDSSAPQIPAGPKESAECLIRSEEGDWRGPAPQTRRAPRASSARARRRNIGNR